jgi:hypothetical protein
VLRVVESYKHLGTRVDNSGMNVGNILSHCRNALSAFAPLALKVYGSELIAVQYRLLFFLTLVISRLLFNLYIIRLKPRDIKRLNSVMMRGFRRILGDMRFSSDTEFTDIEVRRKLGVKSIDAYLMIARLNYLGRVLRSRPTTLIALLHFRSGDKRLPWVELIVHDTVVAAQLGILPDHLAGIDADPAAWQAFAERESAWSAFVDRISFVESMCDEVKTTRSRLLGRACNFSCDYCDAAFASPFARDAHTRARHKVRSVYHARVAASICPCCGTQFHTRLRVLNHLGDRRRPTCGAFVVKHCPVLNPALVLKLAEKDRTDRREAWRSGHTHVLALLPATRRDGTTVGRASR